MGQATSSHPCNIAPPTNHQESSSNRNRALAAALTEAVAVAVADDLTLALPDECLSSILAKLGCQDRNSCSLVCKRWKLIDSKSRQRLVLEARSEISPFLPTILSRFDSISVLSLKCSRKLASIDDHALCLIARLLTSLKKLKLKGCVHITDHGLDASSLLLSRSLRKLSCASCSFTSNGLSLLLQRCNLLQDLTLKRLRKLDTQTPPSQPLLRKDLQALALERLCIKDIHNARLIAPLVSSSKSLKTLIICRSSGLWDPVFNHLHCSLNEIQLENLYMTDAGLISISSTCVDLEVLYISRATHCTDAGFSAIAASCRKLRKLHIDACSKFGNNSIGDEGVMSIATRCSQLQEVVLMGVQLTVLSLDSLASNCPALERMALCNIDSVGDPELGFVAAKFSSLKKLCIKNCPISDVGIEAIAVGCPNLVKLKVKRCREVTHANVCKLKLQRESLVVSLDVESLSLVEEEDMAAEDHDAAVQGGGRRPRTARLATTSTRTHIVCGSRGANLIRSRLGTAMMLRRPSAPSTSSSHTTHR